jgi:hypothetical protein
MSTDAVPSSAPGDPKTGVTVPAGASAARQTPRVPDALLGVADVQALVELKSRATVVNWIKRQLLPAKMLDGKYVIPWATLLVAPLLTRKAVLARRDVQEAGITVAELSKAIADRVVCPADKGMFSLESVKRLIAHAKGEPIVAPVDSAPPVEQEALLHSKSARAAAPMSRGPKLLHEQEAYILEHGDPALLSDEFWAAHTQPPRFIPSAGVFLYRFTSHLFVHQGGVYTAVSRSEGWQRGTDGSPVAVPWKERYTAVEGVYPEEEDPEPFLTANFRYREGERAWAQAWREHCARTGRPLKGEDGRRDRRAVLKRYITEGWSPSDLPPWFWALPEEPEFVAPSGEATYSWGHVYMKPWSDGAAYPFTKIQRSEVWVCGDYGDPVLLPPEDIDEAPGAHQDGDPLPPIWAACNHCYEWARSEWAQCYQLVHPRPEPTTTTTARSANSANRHHSFRSIVITPAA